MVLLRQLIEDSQYNYIANLYPGISTFDYLAKQLIIWINEGHEEFNVEFNRDWFIPLDRAEIVPKSLRELIKVIDHHDDIAKSIHITCTTLQSNSSEPDETGAVTLWYDIIELGSKRAERSLMRILDKYMPKTADPYQNRKPIANRSKPKRTINARQHKRKARRS